MLEAAVEFAPSTPVRGEVKTIRRSRLHTHAAALEIVYVLAGGLHVKVSCEDFDLQVGDFAVLNRGDPHLLAGSPDNVTAVLHIDLAALRDVDPMIEWIVYACESFDLARYRRQEALLRGMVLDLIEGVIADAAAPAGQVRELMRLLCDGYSLEDYYNRSAALTRPQRDKFRDIVKQLWLQADRRDVLDAIATDQHYSKSYVSHLVKDVAAVSFTDLLGYFRVARAEKLLLTTDATMLEISAQCGFSDAKYFTRSYVNWFKQSPADYRRTHLPDVVCDDQFDTVSAELTLELIHDHRRRVAARDEGPRLSVTPLLLKNLGSRKDLFTVVNQREIGTPKPQVAQSHSGVNHLVPIRVTMDDLKSGHLVDGLDSFDQIDTTPCLVLEYSTKSSTLALAAAVAERLPREPVHRVALWLTYTAIHDRGGVDEVVVEARAAHGLELQPILTP